MKYYHPKKYRLGKLLSFNAFLVNLVSEDDINLDNFLISLCVFIAKSSNLTKKTTIALMARRNAPYHLSPRRQSIWSTVKNFRTF